MYVIYIYLIHENNGSGEDVKLIILFYRVMTMMCNTQNTVFVGILSIVQYFKNERIQHFGNWICPRPQVRGETATLLGSLQRANLDHWSSEEDPVSESLWV
jgi:hypothetical protein